MLLIPFKVNKYPQSKATKNTPAVPRQIPLTFMLPKAYPAKQIKNAPINATGVAPIETRLFKKSTIIKTL